MPSGLTYGVHDGKDDLRTYLWRIASQFFHHGEIDPVDKLRLELTESFEHWSLEEAKVELQRLRETSVAEFAEQQAERRAECLAHDEESSRQKGLVRERYVNMQAQVEAWVLPSPLHEGLKTLALRQLAESIEGDCRIYVSAPEEGDPATLRAEAIQRAEEWLARQEGYLAEHLKRTQERIDFLEGLERSIGPRPVQE